MRRRLLLAVLMPLAILAPLVSVMSVAAASDTLASGTYLSPNDPMESTNINEYGGLGFYLIVQSDGNLVLYAPQQSGTSTGRVLWNTKTSNGYYLKMQTDGNLVLYESNFSTAVWNSGTAGHSGAYLKLQTDGNLVVYDGSTALWSSGTYHGADTASIDSGGTGTCWNFYSSTSLCRNTWSTTKPSVYFRAIDQFSTAQSEWATPAQDAVTAWNTAPGPQLYSYTAHSNDTWIYLQASNSGSNGLAASNYAITWNCYASGGSCSDTGGDGTVYFTNIYFNQSTLPTETPLTSGDANLVQNVFAHESGHAMLLGHNPIESSALMWPVGNSTVTGPSTYDTGSGSMCTHGGFGTSCIYDY